MVSPGVTADQIAAEVSAVTPDSTPASPSARDSSVSASEGARPSDGAPAGNSSGSTNATSDSTTSSWWAWITNSLSGVGCAVADGASAVASFAADWSVRPVYYYFTKTLSGAVLQATASTVVVSVMVILATQSVASLPVWTTLGLSATVVFGLSCLIVTGVALAAVLAYFGTGMPTSSSIVTVLFPSSSGSQHVFYESVQQALQDPDASFVAHAVAFVLLHLRLDKILTLFLLLSVTTPLARVYAEKRLGIRDANRYGSLSIVFIAVVTILIQLVFVLATTFASAVATVYVWANPPVQVGLPVVVDFVMGVSVFIFGGLKKVLANAPRVLSPEDLSRSFATALCQDFTRHAQAAYDDYLASKKDKADKNDATWFAAWSAFALCWIAARKAQLGATHPQLPAQALGRPRHVVSVQQVPTGALPLEPVHLRFPRQKGGQNVAAEMFIVPPRSEISDDDVCEVYLRFSDVIFGGTVPAFCLVCLTLTKGEGKTKQIVQLDEVKSYFDRLSSQQKNATSRASSQSKVTTDPKKPSEKEVPAPVETAVLGTAVPARLRVERGQRFLPWTLAGPTTGPENRTREKSRRVDGLGGRTAEAAG